MIEMINIIIKNLINILIILYLKILRDTNKRNIIIQGKL